MEKTIFDYSKLRGKIKEVFGTQEAFANAMGISATSLSSKLNNVVEFSQKEMFSSCTLLGFLYVEIPTYFFYPIS